jgi:glucosylceramidase
VSVVETSGNQQDLLTPQASKQFAQGSSSAANTISVNDGQPYQAMSGFGATLNDVDAYLLMHTSATVRQQVLTELFSQSGIGLDYIRIPIGGNDYSQSSYSGAFPSSSSFSAADNYWSGFQYP